MDAERQVVDRPRNPRKAVKIEANTILKKLSWFTLVELIVVITILAILATVGFLSLSGYSDDAKASVLKANVRTVASAISSESALTGYSPRYYVIHDAAAALSGAFTYIDNSPVALTGGDWNASGTNYSAGNPDYAKLKLNPDKFKISLGNPSRFVIESFAAYDPKSVLVGAVDAAISPTASGKKRSVSYFQVAGILSSNGTVSVSGNFSSPTVSQVFTGAVAWLVKNPSGSWAVIDTATADQYPVLGMTAAKAGKSCAEILGSAVSGSLPDGQYWISPNGWAAFPIYCDMANGGWWVGISSQLVDKRAYDGYAPEGTVWTNWTYAIQDKMYGRVKDPNNCKTIVWQVDDNDTYKIQGYVNGAWIDLCTFGLSSWGGLRSRSCAHSISGVTLLYGTAASGDGSYSLSELKCSGE